MDTRTLLIIGGMALVTFVIRALPQVLLAGRHVPEALDRYLRYLAYALIAAVVSVSLFFAGGRLETDAAPARAAALAVAVVVAARSRRPILGMVAGAIVVLAFA